MIADQPARGHARMRSGVSISRPAVRRLDRTISSRFFVIFVSTSCDLALSAN